MADARRLDIDWVREIYDLWNRGQVEEALAYVHPEVEWHTRWLGTPEVYRGADGLRAFWTELAETWEDIRVEPEDFVPVGDERGVTIERLIGRGRGSGIEIDMRVYEAITAVDGLLLKREVFYDLEEALASFR